MPAAIFREPYNPVTEWIAYVEWERGRSELLARGEWHGYLGEGPPIRSRYVLLRWSLPQVMVAHDDPGEAIKLAVYLEHSLTNYLTTLRDLEPRSVPVLKSIPGASRPS